MNFEFLTIGSLFIIFASILLSTGQFTWGAIVLVVGIFTFLLGMIKREAPGGKIEPTGL